MKRKVLITILSLCCLLGLAMFTLTGCGDKVKGLVSPQNIAYDGYVVTWDKVAVAEYYNVSINGGEKKRVNSNVFTYDAGKQDFEITVGAVNMATELSESKEFHYLPAIENIEVGNDGSLSWENVNGASAYTVSVNGKTAGNVSSNSYNGLVAGSNKVKVKPCVDGDDSYYSLWSKEQSVYINNSPSNIKYDGQKITWTGNASKYQVNINGQKEEVTSAQFVYPSQSADFLVEIVALGNYSTSYDSKPASREFHYLKSVTNLVMTDGILSWDEVDGATEYKIKINNVEQTAKITESKYENLTAGKSLEVSVLPFAGEDYYSVWSEIKTIYILESPVLNWNADLELDGTANNNLTWDAINGAVGYTVEVVKDGDKTVESFGEAQVSYAHAYAEVGSYKIRVKAVSDNDGTYYDSKYSTVLNVERLPAPKPSSSDYIVSDPVNVLAGFTVSYQAVPNASGYQLYKDGVLLSGKFTTALSLSDKSVVDNGITAQQEYNYVVKSMGGVKTISGKKYVTLPCLTDTALSFRITVQAVPTNLTMAGYNAQWSPVAGNNGYSIKYSGTTVTATSENLDLSTIKSGTYGISVCAKGNGKSVLASNYSAEMSVIRLSAPTNIEISYGEGEGKLGYDSVENAKSYQTYIDAGQQPIPENSWDNMYQFIKETGTSLYMVAVANYFNEAGTVYYMTSEPSVTRQFIRLSKPVFPEGALSNSKELLWNAPANINTQEYTPSYEVYEGNVKQTGGNQNATKFSIEYLDGGEYYTFRVKAVGNDSKYLDSEMSDAITVYKLATPSFSISDSKYVWNGVTNASSYILEIDGEIAYAVNHVSGTQYSFAPRFDKIGSHIVKLYAVGDGITTINSNNFTYTQTVASLYAPEITYKYSDSYFSTGGSIIVTITKPSDNAVSYQYEIAGESIVSSELTKSKVIESVGTYYVRVKALGNIFDENDVYYVDSQYVGGNSGYKIILLGAPTLSSISINSDGAVRWATVSDANGYDYRISFDDGEFSDITHTSKTAINPIEGFENYRKIVIRISAYGGSNSLVSSEWVEWTWINPKK